MTHRLHLSNVTALALVMRYVRGWCPCCIGRVDGKPLITSFDGWHWFRTHMAGCLFRTNGDPW